MEVYAVDATLSMQLRLLDGVEDRDGLHTGKKAALPS